MATWPSERRERQAPPTKRESLILSDSYGTDKTHLLAAICNALLARRVSCRFMTAPKLFAALAHQISLDEDYSPLLWQAIQTPLLVIDDIDKAKRVYIL